MNYQYVSDLELRIDRLTERIENVQLTITSPPPGCRGVSTWRDMQRRLLDDLEAQREKLRLERVAALEQLEFHLT